jgi:hypothetical protein
MFYEVYAVALAAALAGNAYDIYTTEKGLKAGVAVEGNDWLVGPKPSALALALRDGLIDSPFIALPLVSHILGNDPLAYGSLAGLAVIAIKHVMGGRAWAKLLLKK